MEKRKLNNEGFSLIELIVVIAIMAILVGALAPQFLKYIESSRQSADMQSASAIKSAVEVGVADGNITADVTVSISGNQLVASGTGVDAAFGSVGLKPATDLKSTGWQAGTVATYNTSSYIWNVVSANGVNTKAPTNDLKNAFK